MALQKDSQASGGETGSSESAAAGSNKPAARPATASPIDLSEKRFSFVQNIIEKTLINQPPSIQAVVLFLFVFLFFYMVISTTQGSLVFKTVVLVELSEPKLREAKQKGQIPADKKKGYEPSTSYQIEFGDRYYGVNSKGEAFIAVPMASYAWALAARTLDVNLSSTGGTSISFSHQIPLKGFALDNISFQAPSAEQQLGAHLPDWPLGDQVLASNRKWELISSAHASPIAGARLYVQSISLSAKSNVSTVSGTLATGGKTQPLMSLSGDFKSMSQAALAARPGASVILNYQAFFPLSEPRVPPQSSIRLQSADGLFGKSFDESFAIPAGLQLGQSATLKSDGENNLVVQLL